MTRQELLRRIGLGLVFCWFMFGGIAHFVALDAYAAIVPPWAPYPRVIAALTGVTDIIGALAFLWPRTRRIAGYALMLYCVCVSPVHIDMLRNASLYAIPPFVLSARLIFQPILIWIIWSVSKPPALPAASASQ
ncbi:MAG: hypothetical protein NW206_15215 [Hyphomonadaceae bacterium]|nr:hypothetical protein [Hyphomonadaceae bacterium]